MSHNKLKIGTVTPDVNGDVTLALNNLSDVSGTPSTDQYLQYNGSGWTAVDVSAGQSNEFIFIGHGESKDYQNSPHGTGAISTSSDMYFYDSNHVNLITGATVTITSGAGDDTDNWISSITLPTGNYIVSAQTLLEFSSSGYAAYAFYNSSNTRLTQIGVVGTNRTTYLGAGDLAHGFIELASQTTIKVRIFNSAGTISAGSSQGNTPAAQGLIIIQKMK